MLFISFSLSYTFFSVVIIGRFFAGVVLVLFMVSMFRTRSVMLKSFFFVCVFVDLIVFCFLYSTAVEPKR